MQRRRVKAIKADNLTRAFGQLVAVGHNSLDLSGYVIYAGFLAYGVNELRGVACQWCCFSAMVGVRCPSWPVSNAGGAGSLFLC